MRRNLISNILDIILHLSLLLLQTRILSRRERRQTGQHLVEKHPQTPNIQRLIMIFSFDHLRSEVVRSPAVGISGGLIIIHGVGPPEIGKLCSPLVVKEDVFRL